VTKRRTSGVPELRVVRPFDVETMVFEWGTIQWMSEPRVTNTSGFTMGVVLIEPGKGHERHIYPGCEEILYVISRQDNQMIGVEGEGWQLVAAGEFGAHPADIFHATINTGWEPLKMAAVYSPPGPEARLRALPGCRRIPPGLILQGPPKFSEHLAEVGYGLGDRFPCAEIKMPGDIASCGGNTNGSLGPSGKPQE
jgi:oxalate decarboxylase/phosphoglucose isomerase-like protein (cupin superfamily)